MIVSLGFYRRKPGLSWEEFSRHWREVHGELLRRPVFAPYLKRYVQHHLRPNPPSAGVRELGFDGFSEAWFESLDSRTRMREVPEYQALILPDEALFIDMAETRVAVIDHPFVQVPGDAAMLALIGAMGAATPLAPGA